MLFKKDPAPPQSMKLVSTGNKATSLLKTVTPTTKMSPLEGFKGDGVVLIGKGTRITGEIKDSSIIEIQGSLEGNIVANTVIVREGASFTGNMISEYVEVHGLVQGTVVAETLLDIRSTGKVTAEVRYGQLSVVTGGRLSGNIVVQETIEAEHNSVEASIEIVALNGRR